MSATPNIFPRLSLSQADVKPSYDVVVIGSGYGGSIAASRCARAGQTVCVLERGSEWRPGQFPESLSEGSKELQVNGNALLAAVTGENPTHLYELTLGDDVSVLTGSGLGGGSLINANAYIEPDVRVYDNAHWPQEIRDDMKTMNDTDRRHVEAMLRPVVYPDNYPSLQKMELMREGAKELLVDIEDLGKIFNKIPLYVNFEDPAVKDTDYRFAQPACNGCGNCCSGCNTGAKNTLNMNYLPDAKVYGADLFTDMSVVSVERNPETKLWNVFYKRHIPDKPELFDLGEHVVKAQYVILGAGSIGSTKILLQSKTRGLDISGKLGSRFTGNGDAVAFSYNGDEVANSMGMETGKYDHAYDGVPGPTIVSVIDLRSLPQMPFEKGMVIEDGTPPGAIKQPYQTTLEASKYIIGVPTDPEDDTPKSGEEALDHTLAFLVMSHDDAGGMIRLNPDTGDAVIDWPRVGKQKNFEEINKRCLELSTALGSTYIHNPIWSEKLGNKLITVHPLGGCPMGRDGSTSVVNHKGQVFIGDTDQVHEGLYVMDGAIMPTSLGVNPTAAISILAERCCRLLAEDAGWHIDYDDHRDFKNIVGRPYLPGLIMTEKMTGNVTFKEDSNDKESACDFVVTIESDDINSMIKDSAHPAKISGNVLCPGLSAKPLTISSGVFNLFVVSETVVGEKEIRYAFDMTSLEGETYHFKGTKYVKKDTFLETGWKDTTTLYVDIFHRTEVANEPIASGILKISIADLAKQIPDITVTNCDSLLEKMKWKAEFYEFYAKTIWNTYFNPWGQ